MAGETRQMVPGGGTVQMFQCVVWDLNSAFYLRFFNALMKLCVSELFTVCHKISDQKVDNMVDNIGAS